MQPKQAPSIWTSVECDAYSRSFNYNHYVNLHQVQGCRGKILTPESYEILCAVFKKIYEIEMEYLNDT